jgi:hypothetical protein
MEDAKMRNAQYLPVLTAVLVVMLAGVAVPARAQPDQLIETLTVPADNGEGTWTSTTLEEGRLYWLFVEGTYQSAYAGQQADGEWHQNYPGGEWEEEHPQPDPDPCQHDLMINDGQGWYNWWGSPLPDPDSVGDFGTFAPHTFSPSHGYWLPYTCVAEGPIRLWIFDNEYVDNSGSLTVQIWTSLCMCGFDLIETLTVPATNGGGAWTSTALEEGKLYWVSVEGTYRSAYAGQQADGEWHQNYPGGEWEEEHPPSEPERFQHDLMINDMGGWYDWWGSALADPDLEDDFGTFAPHTFSPSHRYWLPYPCVVEGPIRLWIFDNEYVDNDGSLTVRIWTARHELVGDLDGDCDVDLADLAILLGNYGKVCN